MRIELPEMTRPSDYNDEGTGKIHKCTDCSNEWPCRFRSCYFDEIYMCIPCKISKGKWRGLT